MEDSSSFHGGLNKCHQYGFLAEVLVSLSKFTYFLALSFFKSLDSIVLPFIWGFKAHRISKTHLHKPGEMGGLGLPYFLHYYWAANARALVYWQEGYNTEVSIDIPPWIAIEMTDVKNSSLPATPALINTQISCNC